MNDQNGWLSRLGNRGSDEPVDGLVLVAGYQRSNNSPEEVAMMMKAEKYGAHAVFFEAGRNGRPPVAQAFVFVSDGPADDGAFAEIHQRLWSWGGVPLLYRKTQGLVQLFRCAHKADFVSRDGDIICNPVKELELAALISSSDAWWNADQLRNGTLWDDTTVCKTMLRVDKAAHKRLIDAVKRLYGELEEKQILKKHLRRKLLILSLLIAYLEERGVFLPDYFGRFLENATRFFQILADGNALVALLADLEDRFNGHVFILEDDDRKSLIGNGQLARFARMVEAQQDEDGQLNIWQLYSFKDLPVEVISHIYQLFVKDADTSVYTPPFLVRLMLGEVLSWERLDRLQQRNEIILDPSCGSGVFLVEAYKRLVLHWRSRNGWKRPGIAILKSLLKKVHGIDLEPPAVELAAFSLCLALCDALEPEEIRASIKLFPPLAGRTLHVSCFFDAKEQGLLKEPIGAVVGNPPFASRLTTPGAERSYKRYEKVHGSLPDKQLAYLFLHDAMEMVAEGGVLSLLQQYNFLYNQKSLGFRRTFIERWDVREILDFISVRGLFHKGGADTKVIVVVAEAAEPPAERKILHATFRRSGRADAEQGFDIDYYDLHWLPRDQALSNDGVWRADLLGGGRVLEFVGQLKKYQTLGQFAAAQGWDYGEGFIEAEPKSDPSGSKRLKLSPAAHLTSKPLLPTLALTENGINRHALSTVGATFFKSAYTPARFSPPMTVVHQQFNVNHGFWDDGYLTYKNQIVGFCGSSSDAGKVKALATFLKNQKRPIQAFVAATSVKLFTQHATTLSALDIVSIPYRENGAYDLSVNEQIVVDDIVDQYRDLIRLGEDSGAMKETGYEALPNFNSVFIGQINAIYRKKPLHPLEPQSWSGIICQPFIFGKGSVDWSGADELRGKLDALLHEQKGTTLHVTRIVRIYDGNFIFLLKPDRLRYWLRSVALRDADETLADLRLQGF